MRDLCQKFSAAGSSFSHRQDFLRDYACGGFPAAQSVRPLFRVKSLISWKASNPRLG